MSSIRKMLMDVVAFFKELVDYPVEIKTEVIDGVTWHWTKWRSGWCKMVGRRASAIASSEWGANASLYYAQIGGRALPFELAELYKSDVRVYPYDSSGYMFLQGTNPASGYSAIPSETYTGNSAVLRSTKPSASIPIIVTYEVSGLWKELGGTA